MEPESEVCRVVPHRRTLEPRSWEEETDGLAVLSSTNSRNNERAAEVSLPVVVVHSGAVNSQISPQIKVKDCTVDITPVTVDKPSRKRKASEVELPRKALRADHLESVQTNVLQADDSTLARPTHTQKGQRSNASKGKGEARVRTHRLLHWLTLLRSN